MAAAEVVELCEAATDREESASLRRLREKKEKQRVEMGGRSVKWEEAEACVAGAGSHSVASHQHVLPCRLSRGSAPRSAMLTIVPQPLLNKVSTCE